MSLRDNHMINLRVKDTYGNELRLAFSSHNVNFP